MPGRHRTHRLQSGPIHPNSGPGNPRAYINVNCRRWFNRTKSNIHTSTLPDPDAITHPRWPGRIRLAPVDREHWRGFRQHNSHFLGASAVRRD
jgi:hypothetical protein